MDFFVKNIFTVADSHSYQKWWGVDEKMLKSIIDTNGKHKTKKYTHRSDHDQSGA
jgi:hypothetical protein